MSQPESGLTQGEEQVMASLVETWNAFVGLEDLYKDDIDDFRRSIHEAQRVLAIRAMRRLHPEVWGRP